jgi:hypothetical protein
MFIEGIKKSEPEPQQTQEQEQKSTPQRFEVGMVVASPRAAPV